MFDFFRVACAVPPVSVGDVGANLRSALDKLREADARGADLVVFPELSVTGYTCGDLFFQQTLLDAASRALETLTEHSRGLGCAFVAGLPLRVAGQLYNAAAVVSRGRLCGVAVKAFIPNYNEYYEKRWFEPAVSLPAGEFTAAELGLHALGGARVPVGGDLVFDMGGARFGVELCEDLWTPLPPSTFLCMGGAELIVNPSASNEVIAKREYRRQLVRQQSARCLCAYAYASAGATESTTDVVFSGHSLVAENGALLCETQREIVEDELIMADVDLGRVRAERLKLKSFGDAAALWRADRPCRLAPVPAEAPRSDGSLRAVSKLPFVPSERRHRLERCDTIFAMQVAGLKSA